MLTMEASPAFAAVDLGSNSFHMIVARFRLGKLEVLAREREMVQLGAGLDSAGVLSNKARQKGFRCIENFQKIIEQHDLEGIRVVGTATLRKAVNGAEFSQAVEEILKCPVEIISGTEEARLIYDGVFNTNDIADDEPMLVVDIGGRSTEIISGTGMEVRPGASIDLGCISVTKGIFPQEVIVSQDILNGQKLIQGQLQDTRTQVEVIPSRVLGASGTIKAIGKIVTSCAWSTDGFITRDSLDRLFASISDATHFKQLKFDDLSKKRLEVFPGGIILLREIFRALGIEKMEVSKGALREGVLFDLLRKHKASKSA